MGYKRSYAVLHLGMLWAVLLVLCAISFHAPLAAAGGVAVGLVSILQADIYYKCPECGKKLPLWAVMPHNCPKRPHFCPGCGRNLRDAKV